MIFPCLAVMASLVSAIMLGVPELDESLSYLATVDANRIAKKALAEGAKIEAKYIRASIRGDLRILGTDRGIGSSVKGKAGRNLIAKAGVAVGKAYRTAGKVVNRGKRKGVGLSSANLHWFGAGTSDRYTGTRTWKTKKGGKRSKPTGNPRHFTGRIDKFKWGGFVQAGATAAEPAVRAAMQKIVAEGVEKAMSERAIAMRIAARPLAASKAKG